jgi:hypothetical protein
VIRDRLERVREAIALDLQYDAENADDEGQETK